MGEHLLVLHIAGKVNSALRVVEIAPKHPKNFLARPQLDAAVVIEVGLYFVVSHTSILATLKMRKGRLGCQWMRNYLFTMGGNVNRIGP